jgi:hypothetical protein
MTDHDKLMQQRATWTDLVKRLHDFVLKVSLVFTCKKDVFKCRPLLVLDKKIQSKKGVTSAFR